MSFSSFSPPGCPHRYPNAVERRRSVPRGPGVGLVVLAALALAATAQAQTPAVCSDVLAHRQAHSEDSLTEHVRGGRYSPVMTRSRGHPGKNEGRRFVPGGLQGCGFALASLLPPTQRSSSSKTQANYRPLGDRIIGRCRSFVKRWAGGAADFSATAGFSVTRWKQEGFTTTA